jgi:hypothetical protein
MMAASAGFRTHAKEDPSAHAVYRPRLLFQIGAAVGCALALVSASLMTLVFAETGGVGLGLILLLIYYSLLAMFWLTYQIVFNDSLLVTAEGLQFQIWGQSGMVPWDNVEYLARRTSGVYRIGGVAVTGLVVARGSGYPVFSPFLVLDSALGRLSDFLPLSYFGAMKWNGEVLDEDHFEGTPLGQDLLHYAPHLFAGD